MGKEKTNANLGFEKQIWDAACVLWGHIPAAEYRKVIIGLIFLRYISCVFEKKYNQLVSEGEGFENDRDAYLEDNVFFVPEEARWDTIAKAAHKPEIGNVIDDAMRAIERENSALKNVLPKNYGNPDLDKKVLGDVVDLFTNEIHMDDTEESKDLLGRTYEYCIAQFAEVEGTSGGEYYTPASIVKIIVSILKPFEDCRVYDPCCGSGGMFVQSEKFLEAHGGRRGHLSVYGQEANADTWKMAKINMAIRGIDADFGPYHADTFGQDLHPTLKADFIMANPPFNQKAWRAENELKDDPRWVGYDVPPTSNANYGWILNIVSKLSANGTAGFLLANGALSGDGTELAIRKQLLLNKVVEAIVILPRNMFYSTDISVTLWILNNNKKARNVEQNGKLVKYRSREDEVLFIDLRQWGEPFEKKYIQFSQEQIQQIAKNYHNWQREGYEQTYHNEPEYCYSATIDEIEQKGWSLVPSKYIEFKNRDEQIDFDTKMRQLQAEMSDLLKQEEESKQALKSLFEKLGYTL